jgi:hypothetical protein
MPLRTRIFIGMGLLVLAFIGAVVVVRFIRSRGGETAEPGATSTTPVPVYQTTPSVPSTTVPTGLQIKPATSLENTQNGVRQLAKVFVERYNSFSTQNNFQNIREVRDLVTPTLWTRISQPLSKPVPLNQTYLSVLAEAMSTTLNSWTDTRAEVLVKVRKTTEETGKKTVESYQDVTVVMVLSGKNWLADSFTAKTR